MPKKRKPDTNLNTMSLANIEQIRKVAPTGPKRDFLAGKEHRAFTREFSKQEPLTAAAILPTAIPAYAAGKALNRTRFLPTSSPLASLITYPAMAAARMIPKKYSPFEYFRGTTPSIDQMSEAYKGLREGLYASSAGVGLRKKVKRLRELSGLS